jgi:hypothetical protein
LLGDDFVVLDQCEIKIAKNTTHGSPSMGSASWSIAQQLSHAQESRSRDLTILERHLDTKRVSAKGIEHCLLDPIARIKRGRHCAQIRIGRSQEAAH